MSKQELLASSWWPLLQVRSFASCTVVKRRMSEERLRERVTSAWHHLSPQRKRHLRPFGSATVSREQTLVRCTSLTLRVDTRSTHSTLISPSPLHQPQNL